MTWITDLIDGHVRLWEQKRLKDAAATASRILIRCREGKFPVALFLDKINDNGEHPTHCLDGPNVDTTLQCFVEQLEPMRDVNEQAVGALLVELHRCGYSVVIVEPPETRTDDSQGLPD